MIQKKEALKREQDSRNQNALLLIFNQQYQFSTTSFCLATFIEVSTKNEKGKNNGACNCNELANGFELV